MRQIITLVAMFFVTLSLPMLHGCSSTPTRGDVSKVAKVRQPGALSPTELKKWNACVEDVYVNCKEYGYPCNYPKIVSISPEEAHQDGISRMNPSPDQLNDKARVGGAAATAILLPPVGLAWMGLEYVQAKKKGAITQEIMATEAKHINAASQSVMKCYGNALGASYGR